MKCKDYYLSYGSRTMLSSETIDVDRPEKDESEFVMTMILSIKPSMMKR